jgi:hypothetical protein
VFIRKKRLKTGGVCYALVESYREGGRVRQRHLAYLGESATVEARVAELDRLAAGCPLTPTINAGMRQEAARLRAIVARGRKEAKKNGG